MATRIRITCTTCGGANVMRDAWAAWDETAQEWRLQTVFDDAHCDDCGRETRLEEQSLSAESVRNIAGDDAIEHREIAAVPMFQGRPVADGFSLPQPPKLAPGDALRMTAAEMRYYCNACRPVAIAAECDTTEPAAVDHAEPEAVTCVDNPATGPTTPDVAALVAIVEQLAARIADLESSPYRANETPAASVAAHAVAEPLPADPRARAVAMHRDTANSGRIAAERARRLRLIRAYLRMRAARDAARAECMRLKSKPHHFGNEVRGDDLSRMTARAEAAERKAASLAARDAMLSDKLATAARQLDTLADRALSAENALRAVQQRNARDTAPFIVTPPPAVPVTYGRAAA